MKGCGLDMQLLFLEGDEKFCVDCVCVCRCAQNQYRTHKLMNKARAGEEDKWPLEMCGALIAHRPCFRACIQARVHSSSERRYVGSPVTDLWTLGVLIHCHSTLTSHHLLQSGPRHYSDSRKGKCQT